MIKSRIFNQLVGFLKDKQPTQGSDVFLQNGINIQGVIKNFDNYGIEIVSNNQSSIISTATINTITVYGDDLIEKALKCFEGFENGELTNAEMQDHVCVPAVKLDCEVSMFFYNRIHLNGKLLNFDGNVMLILGKAIRQGKTVDQLQMVNIDNVVTSSVKAPVFKLA